MLGGATPWSRSYAPADERFSRNVQSRRSTVPTIKLFLEDFADAIQVSIFRQVKFLDTTR